MSSDDHLIDSKIAWHTAKIEQYKERIKYHEMQRHVLKRAKERAITINTISILLVLMTAMMS